MPITTYAKLEMPNKNFDNFVKNDSEKVDLSLFEPSIEISFCRASQDGLKKYARGNWRKAKVEDARRFYAAMKRHQNAELEGEYIDKESGLPHGDHALWNRGVLNYMINKYGYEAVFNQIRGV